MLINCPECGKEISDKAKIFVHCGYPLNESISEIWRSDNSGSYDIALISMSKNSEFAYIKQGISS